MSKQSRILPDLQSNGGMLWAIPLPWITRTKFHTMVGACDYRIKAQVANMSRSFLSASASYQLDFRTSWTLGVLYIPEGSDSALAKKREVVEAFRASNKDKAKNLNILDLYQLAIALTLWSRDFTSLVYGDTITVVIRR